MKLYGSYTSPFVRHCRIALTHLGIPYELVETDHQASKEQSPTHKVPFLEDEHHRLTDSVSILKYAKGLAKEAFFNDIDDFDLFLQVNTAMDATVNVFLLSKEGVTPENSQYLKRQQSRIDTILQNLNDSKQAVVDGALTDGQWRLACYLSWGLFRERFSLDGLDNLQGVLDAAQQDDAFNRTDPTLTPNDI
ncbi:glutathione S-transferase [Idiomarina tyrosinivorans]|uniref:Glutathione S-transferase n=1 Tax=Idiomarina tyrosinivorans TaxID=1445662 RepID=A0A432ZSP4_9GAMM|nr:glutathione S-transferase family protein [Idiomarina tyrosinivorans]RUO80930.1 glutathione S-transferase [Idiomarina tyrosinivorans]